MSYKRGLITYRTNGYLVDEHNCVYEEKFERTFFSIVFNNMKECKTSCYVNNRDEVLYEFFDN